MNNVFRNPNLWIGEAAWGKSRVRHDKETDTVYDPLRRQSALHVPYEGTVLRVPLGLCFMDDIDTIVLGTMQAGGPRVHGVVGISNARQWIQYIEYDEDQQTLYYALPIAELRPHARV